MLQVMQISAAPVLSALAGEVEYPEFIEIMTTTLARLAHKKEEEGGAGNQVRQQPQHTRPAPTHACPPNKRLYSSQALVTSDLAAYGATE
jgi:hypothetical protein